jgi:hypothetical protein
MGYNAHDVLRRVVIYYTKNHKNFRNQFLVMIWIVIILKDETHNLQGIELFSNFHIYSK